MARQKSRFVWINIKSRFRFSTSISTWFKSSLQNIPWPLIFVLCYSRMNIILPKVVVPGQSTTALVHFHEKREQHNVTLRLIRPENEFHTDVLAQNTIVIKGIYLFIMSLSIPIQYFRYYRIKKCSVSLFICPFAYAAPPLFSIFLIFLLLWIGIIFFQIYITLLNNAAPAVRIVFSFQII